MANLDPIQTPNQEQWLGQACVPKPIPKSVILRETAIPLPPPLPLSPPSLFSPSPPPLISYVSPGLMEEEAGQVSIERKKGGVGHSIPGTIGTKPHAVESR